MRWPFDLALDPPYYFWCFCFALLSLLLIEKNLFSPLKRAFLFIFLCLPLFLFSLCLASPFSLLFLCLSLSLSLSFFPSSFLSVSHVNFWFLLFVFVLLVFLFQDVLLFLFSCLLCCFVLNHNITCFPLHLVLLLFFCFYCFGVLLFFECWLPIKNISQILGNSENLQNEKCRKTDILTRIVSTGVFTNSVPSLFCVSSNFAFFAENTMKVWGFS